MYTTTSEVLQAYVDCRRDKRTTDSVIEFEMDLARNICQLRDDLNSGEYQIGSSRVFVVTSPRPREVWAAQFRDRIVHHLIYNRIGARVERTFVAGSSACIPGRGTLYGSARLERHIRSATNNWSKSCHYLAMDISNFFVSISKQLLDDLITEILLDDPWLLALFRQVIWHDPTQDYVISGNVELLGSVPKHKSLFYTLYYFGLAIGNLSSQFLANILMNVLDQYVVHRIKPHGYVRYVDDFVLVDRDLGLLRAAKDELTEVLWSKLLLTPNPTKTKLNSVYNGVDFVGRIVKPWHTVPRLNLSQNALLKLRMGEATTNSLNSTLGLLRQSDAFRERKRICTEALKCGFSLSSGFTKVLA